MEFFENKNYYSPASSEHIKKERNKAKELRKTSWWKQKLSKGICCYCEKKFAPEILTMDHIVPLGRGGVSTKGNIVICCKSCNNEKSVRIPVEDILNSL